MSAPASRTLWEEGREPGREMVSLGVAVALTVAALDLVITDRVGLLFDLGFVVLCVGLALAVRPRDFFTVGVLPPLLMLATFLLLAMSRSEAISQPGESVVPSVVDGLSAHCVALVVGSVAALGVIVVRQRFEGSPESPSAEPGPTTDVSTVAQDADRLEPAGFSRSGPGRPTHA